MTPEQINELIVEAQEALETRDVGIHLLVGNSPVWITAITWDDGMVRMALLNSDETSTVEDSLLIGKETRPKSVPYNFDGWL